MIQFGVLGSVAIGREGGLVPLRAPMRRNLLAELLLNANRVVSRTRLVDVLWGDDPPPTATASLFNHVMRLRALLAAAAVGCITEMAPGYLIELNPEDLDLEVFTGLLRRGRAAGAAGDWQEQADALAAGLALWRGDPLEDVTSPVLRAIEVPRLAELRLEALECRIDAQLRLGRGAEVIAELSGLAAAYPLREHFHAQLMLACYLTGRQADALAAYRRAREVLAEELGVDPGAELRDLHQRILAADPGLAVMPQCPGTGDQSGRPASRWASPSSTRSR